MSAQASNSIFGISARQFALIVVAVVFFLGLVIFVIRPGGAATTVPYLDNDASGFIGLCNKTGVQITSGSVDATPFTWRAVSSKSAPKFYNGPSRMATLVAYLPVKGLPPSDWSGEELTDASAYTNARYPQAAATTSDQSLHDFISNFRPGWDGFVQLRLYLSAEGQAAREIDYPALNIQVTGNTWHALGGGQINCKAGTSKSIETILLSQTHSAGSVLAHTTTTQANLRSRP